MHVPINTCRKLHAILLKIHFCINIQSQCELDFWALKGVIYCPKPMLIPLWSLRAKCPLVLKTFWHTRSIWPWPLHCDQKRSSIAKDQCTCEIYSHNPKIKRGHLLPKTNEPVKFEMGCQVIGGVPFWYKRSMWPWPLKP
jgi:hypothetical protein